jgi:hypothetical protein
MNPSVPTFEQYLWAVRNHKKGDYLGAGRFAEGEHDEGGAIIHATPKSKRREYAARIAGFNQKQRKDADTSRWD